MKIRVVRINFNRGWKNSETVASNLLLSVHSLNENAVFGY